ncbi:urease accessory protein D-like isoform X2 [Bidens hawaiensis]|uniref:urease accessory protein D-like isoform X2 n=1 Tax=Bidens hawaiensis TaxID=980011 RepID=UPI00404A4A31
MESTGRLVVGRVGGKSTVTRCFSKYPLKFIVPTKAGPSSIDAVWIYTLTYGGGIVSGDCISFDVTLEDACTAVLTTQASTKVYKSVASKCSVQLMEVLLENRNVTSIAERMQDYQVTAMVVLLGPKLKDIQNQIQEDVKKMMSAQLHVPSTGGRTKSINGGGYTKPSLIASCNSFGPKGIGVVVRIAATTTESVYRFLHSQLAGMEPMIGLRPYH